MLRVHPLPGVVLPKTGILSFGFQRSDTHVHNGIDLPAPEGTPVLAVADGTVKHSTNAWQQGFTGYGNVVVVAHADGTYALYAHLLQPLVAAGAKVHAGDAIGLVGRTQYSAADHKSMVRGAHLHFEISARPYPMPSSAKRMDPIAWLEGAHASPLSPAPTGAAGSSSRPSLRCPCCGQPRAVGSGSP